jgi:hypothetical protein
MGYLNKYRKEDFRPVSWEEFGKTSEELHKKVEKYVKVNKIKIDAVVPILRGGAFPGTYLAYRLNLLRILPVQYKYFFRGDKMDLKLILPLPKVELPESPVFLVVESNHCFGLTAQTAINDIRAGFPKCRIIYAAYHLDYSYQKMEGVEAVFYGKLTNETKALSKEECEKLNIFPLSYIFPWENIEEEWITVEGKQFKYGDLEKVSAAAETKKVIDLGSL